MSSRRSSSSSPRKSSSSSSEEKPKSRRKSTSKADHPSFRHMITEAIWEDKKWTKGSSRSDIRAFITKTYDVDEAQLKTNLSSTIAKMLEETSAGYPCLIKSGEANYKLHADWRKEWKRRNGIRPIKRKKIKKDKNAPRGPKNGYLFFMQEVRAKRAEQYPDKEAKDITKLVAEEWNSLTEKKKKKYLDLAADDKERYNKELKAYKKKKEMESSESESESRSRSRSPKKKSTKKAKKEDSESESRGKKSKRKHESSESASEKDHKKKKEGDSEEDNTKKKRASEGGKEKVQEKKK